MSLLANVDGNLLDDVKHFVEQGGTLLKYMALKDFIVVLIILYFLKPLLSFRCGTRVNAGKGVRKRGLELLKGMLGEALLNPDDGFDDGLSEDDRWNRLGNFPIIICSCFLRVPCGVGCDVSK